MNLFPGLLALLASVAAASPAPSATAPGAPAAAATLVDTLHFAYAPGTLTVSAGTKVSFTNSDSIAHTVTADDGSFDSGDMAHGTSWSHVFKRAGSYRYFCAYHSYMTGTVVVR